MSRGAWRLLPAAALAWAVAALCVFLPWTAAPTGVACACAAAVGVMVLLRTPGTAPRATLPVVVALGAAAAVATSVAWAAPARQEIADLRIGGGRVLTAEVLVTGKLDRTSRGGLRADATLLLLTIGESVHETSVPIVVLLDDAPPALDMGATARLTTTAFAAGDGDRAVLVLDAESVDEVRPPQGLLAATSWLRERMRAATADLPPPAAGLVAGLAVGDTRSVPVDLSAQMKAASLTHLVAVSGANCALVVGAGYGIGALLAWRRGGRVALGAALLAGFVLLVTPEPSVVRAAAMAAVSMIALITGRDAAGVAVLCVAVTALLIADPWLAFELGFALSVAATAALVTLARPLAAGLSRWLPQWIALALAVPLAAQLACGPLIVLVAPQLSTYGVLANLLATPAAPVATVLGVLGCLAAVAPPVQGVLLWMAWVPAAWIATVAETVSGLPGALLPWPEGIGGVIALAAAGVLVTLAVALRGRRLWVRIAGGGARAMTVTLVGCAAGAIALITVAAPATVPGRWSIAACDVGQGDAIVLRSEGRTMLIDTGPEPEPLAACLRRLAVDRLDIAVFTHFDLDHVGGSASLAGRVVMLLHGPLEQADRWILDQVAASETVQAGEGLSGMLGEASWRVLWPPARSPFPPGNDSSVVIEIGGGGIPSTVLLGDLGAEGQRAMRSRLRPPYQVVKVAHHGSADQDAAFYRSLGAGVAVVSVGVDNDYGHPRGETLDILTSTGMAVARTDQDGMILLSVDAEGSLSWWRERGPPGHRAAPRPDAAGAVLPNPESPGPGVLRYAGVCGRCRDLTLTHAIPRKEPEERALFRRCRRGVRGLASRLSRRRGRVAGA